MKDLQLHTSQMIREALATINTTLNEQLDILCDLTHAKAPMTPHLSPVPLSLQLLRFRDCTDILDDMIPNPDRFRRSWCSEEDKLINNSAETR